MARRHVVVSGHYYASLAGLQVLEAGGNAIDAGVATGLAIDVLESEFVGFGGVAPAMLHLAERGETHVISGVGVWPKVAGIEHFHRNFGGRIPEGLLHTVVPAAPSIWIAALARFGTMSFGEVAASAIRFAREGFPTYPFLAEQLAARHPAERLRTLAHHGGHLPARRPASRGGRDLRARRSRPHAAIHGGSGAGTCPGRSPRRPEGGARCVLSR
jgi:gamma-glutamyltranspeptidase/glutathione hydrolase